MYGRSTAAPQARTISTPEKSDFSFFLSSPGSLPPILLSFKLKTQPPGFPCPADCVSNFDLRCLISPPTSPPPPSPTSTPPPTHKNYSPPQSPLHSSPHSTANQTHHSSTPTAHPDSSAPSPAYTNSYPHKPACHSQTPTPRAPTQTTYESSAPCPNRSSS